MCGEQRISTQIFNYWEVHGGDWGSILSTLQQHEQCVVSNGYPHRSSTIGKYMVVTGAAYCLPYYNTQQCVVSNEYPHRSSTIGKYMVVTGAAYCLPYYNTQQCGSVCPPYAAPVSTMPHVSITSHHTIPHFYIRYDDDDAGVQHSQQINEGRQLSCRTPVL